MTEQETLNKAALAEQHRSWLAHPLTKALVYRLDQHERELSLKVGSQSTSKDISAEFVRLLGAQLGTTQTIRNLVYDTETFIAKCVVK